MIFNVCLQNAIHMNHAIFISTGLQPGVGCGAEPQPFQRLFRDPEAAEAAEMVWPSGITGLKPGANERKTD